jgi:hypothetical protein
MNEGKFEAITLLLLGCGLLVWATANQPSQIIEVRERARTAAADLRFGQRQERSSEPLDLFRASLAEASQTAPALRRSVYVPAYSAIRVASGRGLVNLATTLSIHNTSWDKPLILERVDYHNTHGELIQAYLGEAVALKPLGTIEIFVAHDDLRGGTGANFVVGWAAHEPISEPVVEAVMIGVQGTTSYSFVSKGRPLQLVSNLE